MGLREDLKATRDKARYWRDKALAGRNAFGKHTPRSALDNLQYLHYKALADQLERELKKAALALDGVVKVCAYSEVTRRFYYAILDLLRRQRRPTSIC